MRYWENGFYGEQNESGTRTEITDEYWRELLEGQSAGKEIYEDENHYPRLRECVVTPEEREAWQREIRKRELRAELYELDCDINACMDGAIKAKSEQEYRAERRRLRNELRALDGKPQLQSRA